MQTDFTELKHAALRVPAGPWDWEQEDGSMVTLWGRHGKDFLFSSALCNACHDRLTGGARPNCTMPSPNVRNYISCADPTTILRLLEELNQTTLQRITKIGLWFLFITVLITSVPLAIAALHILFLRGS